MNKMRFLLFRSNNTLTYWHAMHQPFYKFLEPTKRTHKYNAFRTAVGAYRDWLSLKDQQTSSGGQVEEEESCEEILNKIGCYTLIISLLEDRIRVYFWWVAYKCQIKIIGKEDVKEGTVLRTAKEKEFENFKISPNIDDTYCGNITPINEVQKRLNEYNYFKKEESADLKRIFRSRNDIIHNSFINHKKISKELLDEIFDQFRLVDKLLKRFQRKIYRKENSKKII